MPQNRLFHADAHWIRHGLYPEILEFLCSLAPLLAGMLLILMMLMDALSHSEIISRIFALHCLLFLLVEACPMMGRFEQQAMLERAGHVCIGSA